MPEVAEGGVATPLLVAELFPHRLARGSVPSASSPWDGAADTLSKYSHLNLLNLEPTL